jgi:hypothetical protein
MENVKKFLTSNRATTLYWQMANLIVLLLIGLVTETSFYPSLLLPVLNTITKYINRDILQSKK